MALITQPISRPFRSSVATVKFHLHKILDTTGGGAAVPAQGGIDVDHNIEILDKCMYVVYNSYI